MQFAPKIAGPRPDLREYTPNSRHLSNEEYNLIANSCGVIRSPVAAPAIGDPLTAMGYTLPCCDPKESDAQPFDDVIEENTAYLASIAKRRK